MSKIQKDHLNRAAYVYVRQSSLAQVERNLESQRRQYALAERAKDLGWQDIRVIDEDLGRSGSGRVERRGFEALLSEVCQGRAGAVFAIEASRFARNGHDWHRLLEFCQIVDTLIVDHDGVYDPKHPNDRLVLGLKGTMSEVELSMFRQRSQEAIRQKARRGEYFTRIAEGYLLGGSDRLEKDPDEQVQRVNWVSFSEIPGAGQCPAGLSLVPAGRDQAAKARRQGGDRVCLGNALARHPHVEGPNLRRCLHLWPDLSAGGTRQRPQTRDETAICPSGGMGCSASGAS